MILLNMQTKSKYLYNVNKQAHQFYNNRTKRVSEDYVYKCRNVIRKTNNKFPCGQAFQRLLFIDLTTIRSDTHFCK